MNLVNAINSIHDNILALLIMILGVVVAAKYDKVVGGNLITIGAAVWNNRPKAPPTNGNGVPAKTA